ncbi:serine/threonine-protein kinase PAK 3-like [Cyanistes caeruleus]|uniref:serine/threonine-protein kinase PAK 3-like n=1 Tax=Cyanistes caeruleus TaxID=156563 RepID=UPI000CDAFE00|nr:serine/threonine-protein kinase PAK 3-like [Cyanistes caeruleus]
MQLRNTMSVGEPAEKYLELEQIGQGAFGTVSKGLDRATGGEVSVNTPSTSGSSRGLSPLLGAVAGAVGPSRAFLHRLLL